MVKRQTEILCPWENYNKNIDIHQKKAQLGDGHKMGFPLVMALERQRQRDLCDFETNMVYIVNSRPARLLGNTISKTKQTNVQLGSSHKEMSIKLKWLVCKSPTYKGCNCQGDSDWGLEESVADCCARCVCINGIVGTAVQPECISGSTQRTDEFGSSLGTSPHWRLFKVIKKETRKSIYIHMHFTEFNDLT